MTIILQHLVICDRCDDVCVTIESNEKEFERSRVIAAWNHWEQRGCLDICAVCAAFEREQSREREVHCNNSLHGM